MTWKAYAAVSGAGVLATYLGLAKPTLAPEQSAVRPSADVRPESPPIDLGRQALRLQTRVSRTDNYADDPSRDPFRYGSRPAPARRARPETPVPAAPLPQVAPEPPPIRLSGIATQVVGGERQRIAILITPQGPIDAREGDAVGPDYRITRIQDDAVELTGPNGIIRRLPLRP